ncbi:MAG: short-chain dehydrogenase [Gordonia sp.]|nr:short-chain dehydrogenase [Gordonia sp. (in: high G+C Gram-positive bacteria)]
MTTVLEGRRIIVTGAATGIGAAAVEVLTAAGAKVAATYHNTKPKKETSASWIHCDVTDQESVETAFGEAVEALGGLDVLIHAAGLWAAGVPGHIDVANIHKMIDVNFTSTVLTNQVAYSLMKETGGQIVNFGSSEGVSGSKISATYAASKAAVHSWTRSVARAWAADNVTVNAVAPAVATPGADRMREFLGPEGAVQFEQQLKMMIPLGGQLGDPATDLGPVLVFLAGDGARFITGQFLSVTGGLLMVGG